MSFADLTAAEQLSAACKRAVEHYAETGGELRVWGAIVRYVFQHCAEHAWVIDTAGNVVDEAVNFRPDSASLSMNKQRIEGALTASKDSGAPPDPTVH